MQDRYAGDVGDFVKFGLLRHLAGRGMSVGVNWYLTPDESHNADGKHISYLDSPSRRYTSLVACDPDLVPKLAEVVRNERSVAALERSGALPIGSPTYSARLSPALGQSGRQAWHEHALTALADADIVFVDPDNGIRTPIVGGKAHKFAFVPELANYARRGQGLLAYHHHDRSEKAEGHARRRLAELAGGVDQVPVAAIIARRGSCRFFLGTADPAHQDALADALVEFAARWRPHVELVRP
jgi:hypothetical protein